MSKTNINHLINWSTIQTKREYNLVLERIEELSINPPSLESDEGQELMLLGFLAAEYEEKKFPI